MTNHKLFFIVSTSLCAVLSALWLVACTSNNNGGGAGAVTGGLGGSMPIGGMGGISDTGGSMPTDGTDGISGSGGVSGTDSFVPTGGAGDTGGNTDTGGGAGSGGSENGGSGGGDTAGTGGTGGATPLVDMSTPLPSAGCGKTPTLTSGSRTILSSGTNRSFILRIPDTYDNNSPHRLIFAFHWVGGVMEDVDGGGSSGYTWSYYGLREQAGDSTIFVAPQGLNAGWSNTGGQDLIFVDDMIKQIEDDLCVDKTQLFAMGFSFGGGMSFAVACDRATVFRAVAVYSGALLSGCSDGTQPIAYIGVHGITDPRCTIDAGRSLRDKFVSTNGCTPQTPPEPSQGSMTHICTSYDGCSSGHPVRWCAFDGGGHTPAPVDGAAIDSGGGDRTWTKGEVWAFFKQFSSSSN
jgi:poly(3-hydroxybutyrate) depolymerase